jgi:hypothetical protein
VTPSRGEPFAPGKSRHADRLLDPEPGNARRRPSLGERPIEEIAEDDRHLEPVLPAATNREQPEEE